MLCPGPARRRGVRRRAGPGGTVEVDKLADLIVVRQNPLEDINHPRSLELVFRDGQLVADHRSGVAGLFS